MHNKQFDTQKGWVGSNQVVRQRSNVTRHQKFLAKIKATPTCHGPAVVRNLIRSFGDHTDIIVGPNTNNFMYDKAR